MPWRLHRGGRFRRWLGRRFGGDQALGDRAERRILHGAAAVVLLYFVLPTGFFLVLPNEAVLLLGLLVVLALELLRLGAGLELPTIRPYEERRIASYAWYAMAAVAAIVVFPEAIAVAVVLGTALVDPLLGELRLLGGAARWAYPWAGLGLYAVLAALSLSLVGHWDAARTAIGAALSSIIAVAAETASLEIVDDDLAMTLLPGAALVALGLLGGSPPLAL